MNNELEKTFFDTFGIEAKTNQVYGIQLDYHIDEYPQITDRILLGLICTTKGLVITEDCNSVEQLKGGVLKVLINLAQVNNDIKHQVRTLFEEG